MTLPTHILAGAILTEGCLIYSGQPLQVSYFMNPHSMYIGGSCFAVFFLGSIFPDFDTLLFIPHRTLSHWPLVYIFCAIPAYFYVPLLFIFCIAALTHIFLDSCTVMGVPLIKPFGKKYGLKLIYTGGIIEFVFRTLLLCTVILIFIQF